MLILASTSDKIQVTTGQAVTTDVHATWMDYTGSTVTPGRTNTHITSNTTTDVVAAPASSTQRNVRSLIVKNIHVTSSVDVVVQLFDGATAYELFETTLIAGQVLIYADGVGFLVVPVQTVTTLLTRVTGSNATNTTQGLLDVTGLVLALSANTTWMIDAMLTGSTTAVTTGTKYGVAFSGSATIEGGIIGASNATTATTAERISALATATTNAFLLGSAQTGVMRINGVLVVTTAGNLSIQHLKVTSGTSTVFINSWLRAQRIA